MTDYKCSVTKATRVKQAIIKFLWFFIPSLLLIIPVLSTESNFYTLGGSLLWIIYCGYCGYNAYHYGDSFKLTEHAISVFDNQQLEISYPFDSFAVRAQRTVNRYGVLRFTSKMIYIFEADNSNALLARINCNQLNQKTFKRIIWLVKQYNKN